MNRTQQPIYELDNVKVERENRINLKITKFQFHRGTIYGVVGEVGSGKTTLLKTLSGRIELTSGKLLYENEEFAKSWLGKLKPSKDIRYVDSIFPQYRGKVGNLVKEMLPELQVRIKQQYFSGPREAFLWNLDVDKLSLGEGYRLNLIMALESDPKVLLIDDYGIKLDIAMRKEFDNRLKFHAKNRGTTTILSTTEAYIVKNLATVTLFLDNGHIAKVRSQKV